MAENGEAALNTSQPELLHMLWNLTVCCHSLMRKAMRCFSYFNFSSVFSTLVGRGIHSRLHLWVFTAWLPLKCRSFQVSFWWEHLLEFCVCVGRIWSHSGNLLLIRCNRQRVQHTEFLIYLRHCGMCHAKHSDCVYGYSAVCYNFFVSACCCQFGWGGCWLGRNVKRRARTIKFSTSGKHLCHTESTGCLKQG